MVHAAEIPIGLALPATFGLTLMVIVARDVGGQIHEPSEQLLEDQADSSQNGGLLHQLAQLVHSLSHTRSKLFSGLGDKNHITAQVAGSLVMLAVGNLPREVRNQQERVAEPANGIIQDLVRRERLVTALVSQDPQTSTKQTLNNSVQRPQDNPGRHGGHSFRGHIVVEEVEDAGQGGQIAGHIVQAYGNGAVEAVSRNGFSDLLYGEIGKLELVSVRVEHLAVVAANLAIGGHRGKRRG